MHWRGRSCCGRKKRIYGKDGVRDDYRSRGGYYKADSVFDYQVGAADAVSLSVCGFGGQYFSDCHFHSGADVDDDTEDFKRVYSADTARTLDVK